MSHELSDVSGGDTARAYWVVGPQQAEIRTESLPPHTGNTVVVRARFSGISRGTESLVFNGQIPSSEYQRMRGPHQGGEFPWPVKYGYSMVGVVEAGPLDLLGRTVFVLHPHQTRFVVPIEAVVPVPENVPAGRAVLAANIETALNGVWDAGVHVGDRVVVIGAGVVGLGAAWIAASAGADVAVVDIDPERRRVAEALGLRFATPQEAPKDVDVAIHASGSASGLDLAMRLAGFEATVLEMSWYGTRVVSLPLGEAFHARRLVLKSSQVGHVARAQRSRWTLQRRMAYALSLLAAPAFDALISGEDDFDALPAVMARLAAPSSSALCHRLRY